jgi:transcriptional regulator with XRE-family HTH domain
MEKTTSLWATAKVIREARIEAGLSQVQLADFSGLSYPFVSKVERALRE